MQDRPFILIVDDEPDNRILAAGILTTAGWQVDEVDSGDHAIAAVQKHRYDLILMDVQMPGRDGFETTRAIRGMGTAGATAPILAFTTAPPDDSIKRALAAGMDGYIAKPFTPETLLAATDPWRPGQTPSRVASLIAIFGEAEIAGLLSRFRAQLAETLAVDDTPEDRKARAHKIAGISGTLGFAEVSRLWLAVSEGDESAWHDARMAARRLIHNIETGPSVDQTTV